LAPRPEARGVDGDQVTVLKASVFQYPHAQKSLDHEPWYRPKPFGVERLEVIVHGVTVGYILGLDLGHTVQILAQDLIGAGGISPGLMIELTTGTQAQEKQVHGFPEAEGFIIDHLALTVRVRQAGQPAPELREEVAQGSGQFLV